MIRITKFTISLLIVEELEPNVHSSALPICDSQSDSNAQSTNTSADEMIRLFF